MWLENDHNIWRHDIQQNDIWQNVICKNSTNQKENEVELHSAE
jgi:hypothetical protein